MRTSLRGYAVAEVDAFLDRCAASLGTAVQEVPELAGRNVLSTGPRLTAGEVADVQFRIGWRGYSLDDVDRLLDRVETLLRQQAG